MYFTKLLKQFNIILICIPWYTLNILTYIFIIHYPKQSKSILFLYLYFIFKEGFSFLDCQFCSLLHSGCVNNVTCWCFAVGCEYCWWCWIFVMWLQQFPSCWKCVSVEMQLWFLYFSFSVFSLPKMMSVEERNGYGCNKMERLVIFFHVYLWIWLGGMLNIPSQMVSANEFALSDVEYETAIFFSPKLCSWFCCWKNWNLSILNWHLR